MGSYTDVLRINDDIHNFRNPHMKPHLTENVRTISVPKIKSYKDEPFQRSSAFPVENLPITLPTTPIDVNVDHAQVAASCVNKLNHFSPAIFTNEAIWRDIYALTGTLRTFNGLQNITKAWTELSAHHQPSGFRSMPGTSKVVRMGPDHSWIAARYSFVTHGIPATKASGQIAFTQIDGEWKIWMMTTILEELEGFPNPDHMTAAGVRSMTTEHKHGADYEAIIVGAGFAGLCLAGRLKAMGVHYLMIEKNENVGDNWTKRYDSARFHTTKYYSDMPFEPIFRDGYDYFPSGKELARGYQSYADKHQLNIQLSTSLQSATFDEKTEIWTLHTEHNGVKTALRAPHFVFAIGAGGSIPVMPNIANKEAYKGLALHSVTYKNAKDWKGKKGIVVGTANTAHDVAEDMLDAGMDVTMIQRGRTSVFPIDYYRKWSDPIYNPTTNIEEADRQVMATPIALTRQGSIFGHNHMVENDQERFDALERAGFRVERYGDLWKLLSDRLGGHYMDVGASQKVADGLIKVKGDASITEFTETGLGFSDGSNLDADVIVFCTGFSHDVRAEAIKIVGPEIGERLDDYWSIDEEGELRGAYKPHGVPGVWYTGGGVTYARFYSRFLALQIKASVTGNPLKLYKKPVATTV